MICEGNPRGVSTCTSCSWKVVRKTQIDRRNISLLKDEIKKRLEGKVIQLVDVVIPILCGHFKDEVLS